MISGKIIGLCTMFFLLITLLSFPGTPMILLEEQDYLLGDQVSFFVNTSEGTKVEIIHGDSVFRLIGNVSGEHRFFPESLGSHTISVIGSSGVLGSAEFTVSSGEELAVEQDSVIRAEKNDYLLGEEVRILLEENSVVISSVRVVFGESQYSFVGKPEFPLSFYPDSLGEYKVFVTDDSGRNYKAVFSVVPDSKDVQSSSLPSSFSVRDRNGFERNANIKFTEPSAGGISAMGAPAPLALEDLDANKSYNAEIRLSGSPVRDVRINGFVFREDVFVGLDEIPLKSVSLDGVARAYAFSFNSEFEEALLSGTAIGSELYKCDEWGFDEEKCLGTWVKETDLVPGEDYEVKTSSNSTAYAETGVASVNTDKPIYYPGEEASITMVVLDSQGYLVSGADVRLEVTRPSGNASVFSSIQGSIIEEQVGIYKAVYNETYEEGTYSMSISATGANVDSSMSSHFLVREYYEFGILRDTPVTIDPKKDLMKSSITITSYVNSSSFGFTEVLPSNFTVKDSGGAVISEENGKIFLSWNDLGNGSTVSYTARVPGVIPYLWSLGPSFVSYSEGLFYEARPWYLAVDPLVFYDPSSTIQDEWSEGTGTTHAEISKGVRQPDTPSTSTYVASPMNEEEVSEFGFPSIAEEDVDGITLWVYTGTGNNAEYTFYLRQGSNDVCSQYLPGGTITGWYSCTWNDPVGDLSDMRVFLDESTRDGGGGPTNAFVYAAYLEVDTGIPPPEVEIVSPEDNEVVETSSIDFTFKATDNFFSTIDQCTLYANFSGSWESVETITSVANDTETSITRNVDDGVYEWNVLCDNTEGSAFAPSNHTLTVNAEPPLIENAALNETLIRQNRSVLFNATITNAFPIDHAFITLKYPDNSEQNITLSSDGDEYYAVISDTTSTGTYEVTLIWANNTFGRTGFDDSPGLSFEVQAVPPEPFSLLSPPNATESRDLTPLLEWEQTSTPDFANYTILISKDPGFTNPDFVYNTFEITNTSLELPLALDANDVYHWKVIAYDVFGNSKESNETFTYINDRTPPTVTLNNPEDNEFTSLDTINFTYTPSDENTIESCTLYGNFSGVWEAVQTSFSIVNGEENIFQETILEGYNSWNVECTDLAGNAAFASENRTVVVDQTGPVVTLTNPGNNTFIDDTNVVTFNAVAYDELSEVDACELYIDEELRRTETSITDNVEFNFSSVFLSNDEYTWRVQCNDTLGNTGSSGTYNLTVESLDTDPPVITLNQPLEDEHLQSGSVAFNYTVEDATGIENCSLYLNNNLYDTDYSVENFADNFFFASGLAEEEHSWRVECYDNSSELNHGVSSTRNFTVDLTDPDVILESPENNSFLDFNTINFAYTPIDENLDYCSLYTNQSGSFQAIETQQSPVSGEENIITQTMPDGTIIWNIRCFDLSGRNAFADDNFTLSMDTTPPKYDNLFEDPESPATYDPSQSYYFSVEWTDNFEVSSVVFEHNFTGEFVNETPVYEGNDVYSFTIPDLPVGSYTYRWHANDTAGNENQTSLTSYVVGKEESEVELLLDGSPDNITIEENDEVAIQASLVTPVSGYMELYLNSVLINSGAPPLQNNTLFEFPGTYNVTAVYNETQNYTGSSKTLFVTVLDVTPPVVSSVSPSHNSLVGDGEVTFRYNVSDNSPIQSCSLYINNSLEETSTEVQRDVEQQFYVDMEPGVYSWNVSCVDEANNTGWSGTNTFEVVDVDELLVNITFGEEEYEKGDTALISVKVTDIFENLLTADVHTSIISGDTTTPWWDSSWLRRQPISLVETTGENITNGVAEANITGLAGFVSDCSSDIRIVSHANISSQEIPFQVYDGDNSSWCNVAFLASVSAFETNTDYYVYYDHPSPESPGYGFSTDEYVLLNANQAEADEGSPGNIENLIGKNDDTFADISQGSGGGTHSAHGTSFLDMVPGETIFSVQARYRYEVPTATNLDWQLRYSLDEGSSYSTAFSGPSTVSKTTSSWFDITSDYPVLSWSEVNSTRLQGRIVKQGGGGSAELYLYWVELNVSYRPFTSITGSGLGGEEVFVDENTSTASGGSLDWYWSTQGVDVGNYSVVTVASRDSYTTSSGMNTLNIVPDETPPNVTLVFPPDFEERGSGLVNFTYVPFDINLDACTLYIGPLNESLEPNVTEQSPVNNESNTFEDVFVGIGLWEWNVFCNDTEGNSAFADENFVLNISAPDLIVREEGIWFDDTFRVEGINVTVYANISNEGLSDAEDSFAVQFFLGDPGLGGEQLSSDIIVGSLDSFEIVTVNVTYPLVAGDNNVFVVVDPYDEVNETDTDNNVANNTLTVELYQYYYGGSKADIVLASDEASSFLNYLNVSGLSGHVFFADIDSSFSFADLQALTRNMDGDLVSGDFSALDSVMGTSDFKDSITNVWGDGSEVPVMTRTFNLSSGPVHNVPVVYSTEHEDFVTGILWDTADDSGNQRFDASDQEDVVFVTRINPGGQGMYGVYDYEIRVPATLRDYAGSTDKLAFYVEII